jgi:hypothetical protein
MSIAQSIDRYLSLHPFERDCLARGLVNYSKLSRQICDDIGIHQFDAVLVACRRYSSRLKPKKHFEGEIISSLRRAKIGVKIEKGIALLTVKFDKPVKGMLSYISTLFAENDIEPASSEYSKSLAVLEIKSKEIDKALSLLSP